MTSPDMVEKALTAMYSSHNEQERQTAMHWLESFQNSQTAWSVAMHYLTDPAPHHRPEAVFFAAQTIKHKVQVDLKQLDGAGQEQVYKVLQSLAYRHDLTRTVRTQILLALAAFLVQTKTDLVAGVDERVYVELLSLIPEQLNNNKCIHVSDEVYAERKQSLLVRNSATAVPLFLKALSVEEYRQCAVEGLENWIHYADLTEEQAIHILQVAVHLLTREEDGEVAIVEGAAEIVCELVYQNAGNQQFYAAWCHYLPHLCNLLAVDGDRFEDVSLVKPIGSMVLECGELFLGQLLKTPAVLQSLIPAVLNLSAHPDQSVVELTFNFWTELELILESGDANTRDAFIPVYTDLFRCLLPRLQFPADTVVVSAEERESFRDFRHIVGDCLKDCVRVSGSTAVVELILTAFEQAVTLQTQWQPLEAVLFALRTIASVIDRRESERLPTLFPMILSIRSHPRLTYSCLLVIGCLSDWLKYHQDLLPPAIDYIVMGLTGTGDTEVTAAAAMAMRYLCESCGDLMVRFAPQLLSLYDTALCQPTLDQEDQLSLTESICHVIVADVANIDTLLPLALHKHLHTLTLFKQSAGEQVNMALQHLALFVELIVPDSISIISTDFAMTGCYQRDIEPLIYVVAECHGGAVSDGVASLLKAAISRYSRSLGQSWLAGIVALCQRLFKAYKFPQAVYTLRYAVLLGDCNVAVQQSMLQDLTANFQLYAERPLDCLNLVTSMYDYWRGIGNDPSLLQSILSLIHNIVQDSSQPATELSAALIVTLRMAMHTPTLATTAAANYHSLLHSIITNALLHFPAQVQSDCATLLHRYSRLTSPQAVAALFDQCYAVMPVEGCEREAWRVSVVEALGESRPKALKSVIVSQSSAVRRRL